MVQMAIVRKEWGGQVAGNNKNEKFTEITEKGEAKVKRKGAKQEVEMQRDKAMKVENWWDMLEEKIETSKVDPVDIQKSGKIGQKLIFRQMIIIQQVVKDVHPRMASLRSVNKTLW